MKGIYTSANAFHSLYPQAMSFNSAIKDYMSSMANSSCIRFAAYAWDGGDVQGLKNAIMEFFGVTFCRTTAGESTKIVVHGITLVVTLSDKPRTSTFGLCEDF